MDPSFFFTGEAQGEDDGAIIPSVSTFSISAFNSSRKWSGIRRACSLQGWTSPVSMAFCTTFVRPIAWSAHVNVVWNGRRISCRRSRSSWFMCLGSTSSIVVGFCGGSSATESTSTSVVWLGSRVIAPPPWSNVTAALCCRNKSTQLWPAT